MCLEWLFPLTGFGAAESGVDLCVLRSFIIISTLVFIASWLAVAISNFGGARIICVVASTSKPVVFSRTKRVIGVVRAAMDLGFS